MERHYFWPKMRETIAQYLLNCEICKRVKSTHHAPHGYLKPLPIPQQPWEEISMDFVSGQPTSNTYNCGLVVVDRLSKMRHLIPCHTAVDAEETEKLYLHNVRKLHGLPFHITSDRGTQFMSRFWKALCKQLKIQARMSVAYHPEIERQTERLIAGMKQYLRCYVFYKQNNWAEWLPMAEFATNNQVSSTTK